MTWTLFLEWVVYLIAVVLYGFGVGVVMSLCVCGGRDDRDAQKAGRR